MTVFPFFSSLFLYHILYLFVVSYVLASKMMMLFLFVLCICVIRNVWNMIGFGMWWNTKFYVFKYIEQKDILSSKKKKIFQISIAYGYCCNS